MSYYNRYTPATNWREVRFLPSRVVQSAELNEVQAILRRMIDQLGTSIFRDGSILSGCDLLVSEEKTTVRILPGRVYVRGYIHEMADTTLSITGEGEEIIGVRVDEVVQTSAENPDLLDPAAGYRNYGAPGADRLVVTAQWTVNDPNATPIYRLVDGAMPVTPTVPAFDAILELLARRTNDESGSYLVSGMRTRMAPGIDPNTIMAIVESGKAYVQGWEITKGAPTKLVIPKARDFVDVTSEPKVYTTGTAIYNLNNSPVRQVSQVTATVEVTEQITRGGVAGGTDRLSHTPVAQIVQITQGGTTYVQEDDYELSGDDVDWSPGGAEPSAGTTYSVTYRYIKTMEKGTRVLTEIDESVIRDNDGDEDALAHGTAEDFVRVLSVYDNNGEYVEGQDYTVANPGKIVWKQSGNKPNGGAAYKVLYWYWDHDIEGDFTSYDSYDLNGLTNDTSVIPNRNAVNFAPNGDNPVNGTTFYVNYDYYLPRRDLLVVNRNGDILRLQGQSARNPAEPLAPVDVLPLAVLHIPADGNHNDVTVHNLELKRVTMQELQHLIGRVEQSEYNAAVSDLEESARNREATVQKKGIWTDAFIDFERADIGHSDFNCAIDMLSHELRPPFTTEEFSPAISSSSTASRSASLALLPYTEAVRLRQMAATGTMNVNPYNVFTPPPPPPPIEEEEPPTTTEPEPPPATPGDVPPPPPPPPPEPEHPTVATITIDPDHDLWMEVVVDRRTSSSRSLSAIARMSWNLVPIWQVFDAVGTRTPVGSVVLTAIQRASQSAFNLLSQMLSRGQVETIMMRQLTITVTGTGWAPNEDNIACAFDGQRVTLTPTGGTQAGTQAGTVKANAQGQFTATFQIPPNIPVGARVVRCQSAERRAEAIYTATGAPVRPIQIPQRTRPIDPLAQSFTVQESGWYTKLDVYFATKDEGDTPIRVEIRTMTDSGFPSSTVLAAKVLTPSEVSVSDDGTVPTSITFDDPVFLRAGTQYAIALVTTSDDYSVYVAELGQQDIMTGQWVATQPYLDGVLFSSSNAMSWTIHQTMDLKFRLHGAAFTAQNAELIFNNITDTELSSFAVLATQEVLENTRVDWFYSTNGGMTWVAFSPGETVRLANVATQLQIKAILTGNEIISPSVRTRGTTVLGYLNELSGSYIGRNVSLADNYTRARVYVQLATPSGCTQTVKISNDDGATWVTPTQIAVTPIDLEFSEYTFEHEFSGGGTKNFRVRIDQTTNNPAVVPRARNLMTTQN